MDDNKRQDQIQKVELLIQKQNVSRRDFFGSLGKIAVLSQVVALGGFNFLTSCVAMEDKKDASGKLKLNCDFYDCPPDINYQCVKTFGCAGDFTCEVQFLCGIDKNFTCNPVNYEFNCLGQFTPHYGGGS